MPIKNISTPAPGSQNITKIYHEEIRVPANIKIAIPCRTKKLILEGTALKQSKHYTHAYDTH